MIGDGSDKRKRTEEETEVNVWLSLLSQVQTYGPNKLPSGKSLLVLGDNESGKSSLVAKLQGIEEPRKGSGLEYHYFVARDEYRDDQTRLGVWILDGDPWHRNLLKFLLNEESLPDTTVLLTAAMTEPWNILDSLESWTTIIREHLDRAKLSADMLEQSKSEVSRRFTNYVEPRDDMLMNSFYQSYNMGSTSDDTETLSCNIGLDIIVIITKTDYMDILEKEFDYKDEHFDFIQQALRKFCLKYGASLVYTSVKEDKNCELLWKYILHLIYGFPFKTPALIMEKDIVFIPAGWDSQKKIEILNENLTCVTPDDSYSSVVSRPLLKRTLGRELEVVAENDQAFLLKQLSLLNQPLPAVNKVDVMRTPSTQKYAERRVAGTGAPFSTSTPKKIEGKPSPGSEQLLHSFFSNLLKKPPGSSAIITAVQKSEDPRRISKIGNIPGKVEDLAERPCVNSSINLESSIGEARQESGLPK